MVQVEQEVLELELDKVLEVEGVLVVEGKFEVDIEVELAVLVELEEGSWISVRLVVVDVEVETALVDFGHNLNSMELLGLDLDVVVPNVLGCSCCQTGLESRKVHMEVARVEQVAP